MASSGYAGTVEGIERELIALNKTVDTKFAAHDLVLANHHKRISTLENRP